MANKAKSEKEEAEFLRGSIISAALNALMSVSFGIITFSLNAYILRHVSKDVLGTINVRLVLLSRALLFFGRESFRRACMKKPENNNEWRSKCTTMECIGAGFIFS